MSKARASSYDVVMVGGRVAGASTAMLLARAGLRVLVVDKARAGTDTLSTHALMRGGVLQLHRWGVLDAVVAAGTPAVRHTVFHVDEERTDISIRPAYGVDALYAPRRYLLDRLLSEAAQEAGADVRFGVHATGLVWRDRRVAGVVLREPGGVEHVVDADLVIGADGARSRVAEWVQARLLRTASATAGGVYGYFRGLPAVGYEWMYGAGATAGFIPTNDGATCVFASAPPAVVRAHAQRGLETALELLVTRASVSSARRLRGAEQVSHLRGYLGQPGHVRQAWGPGWALVGDAGYYKDPITAHGITDALRDAQLLADAVIASPSPRHTATLAAYQKRRDALSVPLFEVTEEVARFRWDADRIKVLLRELSSTMAVELEDMTSDFGTTADVLTPAG